MSEEKRTGKTKRAIINFGAELYERLRSRAVEIDSVKPNVSALVRFYCADGLDRDGVEPIPESMLIGDDLIEALVENDAESY